MKNLILLTLLILTLNIPIKTSAQSEIANCEAQLPPGREVMRSYTPNVKRSYCQRIGGNFLRARSAENEDVGDCVVSERVFSMSEVSTIANNLKSCITSASDRNLMLIKAELSLIKLELLKELQNSQ